jgi:hypothetical protein
MGRWRRLGTAAPIINRPDHANLGRAWAGLRRRGGEGRRGRGWGRGFGRLPGAGGLQAAEQGDSLAEGASGGGAEAVDAADGGLPGEGEADVTELVLVVGEGLIGGSPDLSLEIAKAAEHPLGVDELVYQGAFGRGSGLVFAGELLLEQFEVGFAFA